MLLIVLAFMWIAGSSGLVSYNKFLLDEARFPFPTHLVLLHTLVTFLLTAVLLAAKPSLFPSLTGRPEERVPVDRSLLLKGMVPVALLFGVSKILSNFAYLYSSVSFLQMMKECNVVVGFCVAASLSIEKVTRTKVELMVLIVFATFITVRGAVVFSPVGFLVQGASQLAECVKLCLQVLLLTNAGRKLDPLSFVLLLMPFCFAFTAPYAAYTSFRDGFAWNKVVLWAPHLVWNSLLAFYLNVVSMCFIERASAMGVLLGGMVKDIMTVYLAFAFLGDYMSRAQIVGFSIQLTGVFWWSVAKMYPEKFNEGCLKGLWQLGLECWKPSGATKGDHMESVCIAQNGKHGKLGVNFSSTPSSDEESALPCAAASVRSSQYGAAQSTRI